MGNFLNWYKNINDGLNNSVGLNKLGLNAANIGGIANTLATTTGQLLAGQNTTGAGQAMQGIGSALSNIPGFGIGGAALNFLGGITNAAFGSDINEEFVNQTESMANQQANYISGASDNAQLLADYNNLIFLGDVKKSDVGTEGWFSNKVSKETRRLNRLNDEANMRALASLANTAENIDRQNDLMLMANYSANGGPINMLYTGTMSPFGNRFDGGGPLFTNGAIWSNNVTFINNGDTHENNIYEGVQLGVDNQGVPNLVEEGEIIWNDYVFSNRLRVPKAVRKKYKLSENKNMTFADAAKQAQKESEERPNDPISKRGLEAAMSRLQYEQEIVRASKSNTGKKNQFKDGGPKDSYLRYLPAVMSTASVINDMFGGNDPNYSNADSFEQAIAGTSTPITYTPISNYLAYRPFDVNRLVNRLDRDTAATRRSIINTSGGNRAAALTGLLALDRNYNEGLGEIGFKGDELNLAQRQAVEQFNRATNQANSEMGIKAAMANAEQAMNRAKLYGSLAEMRQNIYERNRAEKAANLTNAIDNWANVGREISDRNTLQWLIDKGVLRSPDTGTTNTYTIPEFDEMPLSDYVDDVLFGAYGGKIKRNKKKRGGFTV